LHRRPDKNRPIAPRHRDSPRHRLSHRRLHSSAAPLPHRPRLRRTTVTAGRRLVDLQRRISSNCRLHGLGASSYASGYGPKAIAIWADRIRGMGCRRPTGRAPAGLPHSAPPKPVPTTYTSTSTNGHESACHPPMPSASKRPRLAKAGHRHNPGRLCKIPTQSLAP